MELKKYQLQVIKDLDLSLIHILSRYFVEKGYKTGRPRCAAQKLLKVILFAFMENGICSLREIEKLCRNDIRYMLSLIHIWLHQKLF